MTETPEFRLAIALFRLSVELLNLVILELNRAREALNG